MLSKNRIKFIKSLQQKKFRSEHQLYIVERAKIVNELIHTDFKIESLYCTQDWFDEKNQFISSELETTIVKKEALKAISLLKSPPEVIAICHQNQFNINDFEANQWCLYLDGIQDPGNLGAILRIADWFGIQTIFHSFDTVDLYNPKVIQASMGSFLRVNMIESTLEKIKERTQLKAFGAFMEGENVFTSTFTDKGILVIGNEGKGIRNNNHDLIDEKISIPKIGSAAESLNAAVATGILCAQITSK